jgi:ABC-type branched-subunit amino acid transport system substrate-binding protein
MRILVLLVLVLASCTSGPQKKKIDESQISEATRLKLDEARDLIKSNKAKLAISKLAELNDNNLSPVEKSLKYNLKGVTLFNLNEVEKAILNFEISDKYAPRDTQLYSQVQLNMGSGYFKIGQWNELQERLEKIDRKQLTEVEIKKYAQLRHAYGTKIQNHPIIVESSIFLMTGVKTFSEIQSSPLYPALKESFAKLSQGEKIELLEDLNNTDNLTVAHLAQLEAEERYLSGDKKGSEDVVAWLKTEFGENVEVQKYLNEFELRMQNSSRISISDVGVVLPLTGEKGSFGQKALSGIDTGLKIFGLNENVKVHTKDSVDNPAQAAQAVLDLIRQNKVSFIIGGLFPESAKAEYLEARKYGVLYISLSQINLPKEEKNHNLIEIQGSIESQVETLLSEEMIKKFGPRIGVVFPDNEGGKAYVEEIWRKATQKNLQVTSVASFAKNTHDYRDTAQLFLGLKYERERSEELRILDDVYSQERTTIRRVQTLPPVLDFDWVFLATYPHEATQLIPTLAYYDANKIKVIGGPSWVSKSMVKEQKNLGTLYFVGDDPKDLNQEILTNFQEIYGKPASLIEILSLDAMKVGAEALRLTGLVTGRDEFDSKLKEQGKLRGLTTDFEFKEGVWMKKMNSMAITRGEIVKIFSEAQAEEVKAQ